MRICFCIWKSQLKVEGGAGFAIMCILVYRILFAIWCRFSYFCLLYFKYPWKWTIPGCFSTGWLMPRLFSYVYHENMLLFLTGRFVHKVSIVHARQKRRQNQFPLYHIDKLLQIQGLELRVGREWHQIYLVMTCIGMLEKLIPEYYVNIPWSCGYDLHSRSSPAIQFLSSWYCKLLSFSFPPPSQSNLYAWGIVVINYRGTELKMVCRLSKKLSAVSLKSGEWCAKTATFPCSCHTCRQWAAAFNFCLSPWALESSWIYWFNNCSILGTLLLSCDHEIWF